MDPDQKVEFAEPGLDHVTTETLADTGETVSVRREGACTHKHAYQRA